MSELPPSSTRAPAVPSQRTLARLRAPTTVRQHVDKRFGATCEFCGRSSVPIAAADRASAWAFLQRIGWTRSINRAACPGCSA